MLFTAWGLTLIPGPHLCHFAPQVGVQGSSPKHFLERLVNPIASQRFKAGQNVWLRRADEIHAQTLKISQVHLQVLEFLLTTLSVATIQTPEASLCPVCSLQVIFFVIMLLGFRMEVVEKVLLSSKRLEHYTLLHELVLAPLMSNHNSLWLQLPNDSGSIFQKNIAFSQLNAKDIQISFHLFMPSCPSSFDHWTITTFWCRLVEVYWDESCRSTTHHACPEDARLGAITSWKSDEILFIIYEYLWYFMIRRNFACEYQKPWSLADLKWNSSFIQGEINKNQKKGTLYIPPMAAWIIHQQAGWTSVY